MAPFRLAQRAQVKRALTWPRGWYGPPLPERGDGYRGGACLVDGANMLLYRAGGGGPAKVTPAQPTGQSDDDYKQ